MTVMMMVMIMVTMEVKEERIKRRQSFTNRAVLRERCLSRVEWFRFPIMRMMKMKTKTKTRIEMKMKM